MQAQNLSDAHILLESIAGEEDPGASLDIVRAILKKEQQSATELVEQTTPHPTDDADVTSGEVPPPQ